MATIAREFGTNDERGMPLKQFYASLAVAVVVASALMAAARAVPPTVTPSPGYDARLQEQKTAPVAQDRKRVLRRPVKPVHDNAH
jgi:hypothetical protein